MKLSGHARSTSLSSLSKLCHRHGVFFSLDNPLSSALWRQPALTTMISRFGELVDLDHCRFGAHYKKPIRLYANLPGASTLARRCCGCHIHDQLRGTVTFRGKSRWKTSLASAYPPAFARAVAVLARDAIAAKILARQGEAFQRGRDCASSDKVAQRNVSLHRHEQGWRLCCP